MAGYKLWAADEVLTAADLNGYLMTQAVPRFADVSARAGAILSPAVGQLTYRIDAGIFERWNGSAWAEITVTNATNAVNATNSTNATNATNATTASNALKVGGITIFNSSSTPTANATGDLWFY